MSAFRKLVGNKGPSVNTNAAQGLDEVDPSSAQLAEESLWGIENYSNTCYCNSIIQALYACAPFREFVDAYPGIIPPRQPIGPTDAEKRYPNIDWDGPIPGWDPLVRLNKQHKAFAVSDSATPMSPGLGKEKRNWMGRKQSLAGMSPLTPGQLQAIAQDQASSLPDPFADLNDHLLTNFSPSQTTSPPTLFQTLQTLFYHFSNSPPHMPIKGKGETREADSALVEVSEPPRAQSQTDGSAGESTDPSVPSPRPATQAAPPAQPAQPNPKPGGSQPVLPMKLASLPHQSALRESGPWRAGQSGWGVVRPDDFMAKIKGTFPQFNNTAQHDAHEFLTELWDALSRDVDEMHRKAKAEGNESTLPPRPPKAKTFIEALYQGVWSNETRCLSCETTTSRVETFMEVGVALEQHQSITEALRQISTSEMMYGRNKFACDTCSGYQEAEIRMRIKVLPPVLTIHLKRFDRLYDDRGSPRFTKLLYRIQYPRQLRVPNTTDDAKNPDQLYELIAIVVHVGGGAQQGHYVTVKRTSCGRWVMCDDDNVEPLSEDDLMYWMGDRPNGAAYVLFYQAVGLTAESLGLKGKPKPASKVFKPTGDAVVSLDMTKKVNGDRKDVEVEQEMAASISSPFVGSPAAMSPALPQASPAISANGGPDRQLGFHTTPSYVSSINSASTARPPLRKEDSKKWYRMSGIAGGGKEKDRDKNASLTINEKEKTANGSSSSRPSTGQTTSSAVSAPEPGLPILGQASAGASPTNMSSSVMSSFSAASASTDASTTPTALSQSQTPSAGRPITVVVPQPPSQPPSSLSSSSQVSGISVADRQRNLSGKERNRTTSSSSVSSNSAGGSLGRRISGISKLGRSGSMAFGKIGFGKKDGIQEEKKK